MKRTDSLMLKQIPGYSYYYVSKTGKFYSIKSGKLLRMKVYKCDDGYCTIKLVSDTGKSYKKGVHIYIALTYIPNPNNLPTVNHIDGNGYNNNVSNLEWASRSYQVKHAIETGLLKHHRRPVVQADKNGNLINEFPDIKRASKVTGIDEAAISKVCMRQHKYRTAGGFAWYYKENFRGQKLRKIGNVKGVIQYDEEGEFIQEFESPAEAAEHLGIRVRKIRDACWKNKICEGYNWEYAPKETKEDPVKKYKNWIILEDFPKYGISRDGRIFSYYVKREIKPTVWSNKVQTISLTNKNNKTQKMKVHRLVAKAYLPNPKNYPLVKHLDDNPSNNNVKNLEWGTKSSNGLDAYKTGANSGRRPVIRLDAKTGEELEHYESIKQASEMMNGVRSAIEAALSGESKTSYGYKWIYAEKQIRSQKLKISLKN